MTEAGPRKRTGRTASWPRKIVRGTGRTLVTAGVLVLLFVVYELFITNFLTDRAQQSLRSDLIHGDIPNRPIPGQALGIIQIPKIGLDMAIVEGTCIDDLKLGPGHYDGRCGGSKRGTPLPGEDGNVGIAGHRTTYAKPFWSLDELVAGDEIYVWTLDGKFTYEVQWQRVVKPWDIYVLDQPRRDGVALLTLTTCTPKFSAAERLIIRAEQVGDPESAKKLIRGAF
ncbi:MAG: sortase [Actinomycetota bacterium]